jgi:ABC-type uncharacterized transport system substrate-binding protein
MKRREFIAGLGSTVAWPVVARAQQADRVRRIGVLVNGLESDSDSIGRLAVFRQALRDLGWGPGANVRLDVRFGVDDDQLGKQAKELVGLAPDVILASTPPSVLAVQKFTHAVPIVFAAVTDPVGLGIVQNLARPGGNATGFLSAEFGFGAKWLELLKELAPGITRVGVLREPGTPPAAVGRRHLLSPSEASLAIS